jgi:hypothetical protein
LRREQIEREVQDMELQEAEILNEQALAAMDDA